MTTVNRGAIGGAYIGMASPNRAALVEYLIAQANHLRNVDWERDNVALRVPLDGLCGTVVVYPTLSDIPEESVPCPCGDKSHWIIKYEEAP